MSPIPIDDRARADRPAAPRIDRAGPFLYYRGHHGDRVSLAVILVRPERENPPDLHAEGGTVRAEPLYVWHGGKVWRYSFDLATQPDASYTLDGARYPVETVMSGDLRIAYVSCNGQEHGDRERPGEERNVLWQRLGRQHEADPFHLLLQGGDQIYADEMLDSRPELRAWRDGEPPATRDPNVLLAIRNALRTHLFDRYLQLYTQDGPAALLARIPSLCMWDDHDICDGWGSLKPAQLDSPIGRAVFGVARELFMLFQLGAHPDGPPPICLDPGGGTLSWAASLPGVDLVAPDLRSGRRPDRVMSELGHDTFDRAMDAATAERVFVLSSVPVLGPRLSWVERGLLLMPGVQKYEDDLRDQWQSRVHRAEWRRFLRRLLDSHGRPDQHVTVLSGEIHLATHGTLAYGPRPMHQLVASGITHPPAPRRYARSLGALARLGESPLPGHPIRLQPLPGQRGIYTAQRNYLILERTDGAWHARWELEHDGTTPALPL